MLTVYLVDLWYPQPLISVGRSLYVRIRWLSNRIFGVVFLLSLTGATAPIRRTKCSAQQGLVAPADSTSDTSLNDTTRFEFLPQQNIMAHCVPTFPGTMNSPGQSRRRVFPNFKYCNQLPRCADRSPTAPRSTGHRTSKIERQACLLLLRPRPFGISIMTKVWNISARFSQNSSATWCKRFIA